MALSQLFSEVLSDNLASLTIKADSMIHAETNDAVVPCRSLAVEEFARLGFCELQPAEDPRPGAYRYWGGESHDQLYTQYEQVVWQIRWQGKSLRVIHLQWDSGCGRGSRDWVVADSIELAEAFVLEVERQTHAPKNSLLVFSGGRWSRSEDLYEATQSASFDSLVLADEMKTTIRNDFSQFLKSEERYRRLGIAWRRGALMIGPPGNGKTHCVRALVKELGVSSLYVQSLSDRHRTAEQMWAAVFDRARGLCPCVLILEDLDSLVDKSNRSFFLNQLDGFDQNHGMMILATTNHPHRIDSAIIDRPSRFDRKYHFNLPTQNERREFLIGWQRKLADETGWKSEQIETLATNTEGFSFAYIKELVISSVMRWMQDPSEDFASTANGQAGVLLQQMKTESELSSGGLRRSRS